MIRISKNILFNPAEILISGIKCDFKNITEIVNVLGCKWIVVTIDSLTEESSLLSLIKNQGLKYYIERGPVNYIEVSVSIPHSLFEDILKRALSEDPENICIMNFLDSEGRDVQLQHPFRDLVITGIAKAFISIALDENAMLIYVNKSLIQAKELYRKIKALRFN